MFTERELSVFCHVTTNLHHPRRKRFLLENLKFRAYWLDLLWQLYQFGSVVFKGEYEKEITVVAGLLIDEDPEIVKGTRQGLIVTIALLKLSFLNETLYRSIITHTRITGEKSDVVEDDFQKLYLPLDSLDQLDNEQFQILQIILNNGPFNQLSLMFYINDKVNENPPDYWNKICEMVKCAFITSVEFHFWPGHFSRFRNDLKNQLRTAADGNPCLQFIYYHIDGQIKTISLEETRQNNHLISPLTVSSLIPDAFQETIPTVIIPGEIPQRTTSAPLRSIGKQPTLWQRKRTNSDPPPLTVTLISNWIPVVV